MIFASFRIVITKGDVMRRVFAITALCVSVAACAANPQKTTMELAVTDPKYNSKECQEIRLKALEYNDRVVERAALGLVGGLLLGPFALPMAIAADSSQNQQRDAFNQEIETRCMTNPPKRLPPQAPAVSVDERFPKPVVQ